MRTPRPWPLLAAVLLAPTARAVDPSAIARDGAPGIPACASCHGAAGQGQARFPRLAGLDAGYLRKQLDDFAAGRRASPVMAPVAGRLAPADRDALARYFARQAAPAAAPVAEPTPPPRAARIAWQGAWDRGTPACVQCHGPGGVGVGAHFPALAAQPAGYLADQLRAFRAGTRRNDPQQLMRTAAAALDDAEVEAVAAWFARQPPAGGTGAK